MQAFKLIALMVGMSALLLSGCGGGGGGTITVPSTKTATLKFSSQSTNIGDLISGFTLDVSLPAGSVIPTDAPGFPLSNAVYMSGEFNGAIFIFPVNPYESALRKLSLLYASDNSYQLGEFVTILVTVPSSYVPQMSDVKYLFAAWDSTGNLMPTVTATATFN